MASFPGNQQPSKSYSNFRFRVKWDDTYVLGVSKVSGLTATTQVIQHREGVDPSPVHLAPGQAKYSPITMERGVSYDPTFEQWANKVFDWSNSDSTAGQNPSLLDCRKDLVLEVYNEAGMKVIAYNIHRAWVSEFTGMPELDGLGNALVVESIVIQNEGCEREDAVTDEAELVVPPVKNLSP